MATARMDVSSYVGKLLEEDDVDVLREGVQVLAQALMETEVSSHIGAAPTSGLPRAPRTATATAPGRGTRAWARSSSRSPRSRPVATSGLCSSRGGGPAFMTSNHSCAEREVEFAAPTQIAPAHQQPTKSHVIVL
jgi:hypothetical protein